MATGICWGLAAAAFKIKPRTAKIYQGLWMERLKNLTLKIESTNTRASSESNSDGGNQLLMFLMNWHGGGAQDKQLSLLNADVHKI